MIIVVYTTDEAGATHLTTRLKRRDIPFIHAVATTPDGEPTLTHEVAVNEIHVDVVREIELLPDFAYPSNYLLPEKEWKVLDRLQ